MLRKYQAAVSDRNQQQEAHRGFSDSLPRDTLASWELMCSAWDTDGFPKSLPNPFHTAEAGKYCLFNLRSFFGNLLPTMSDVSEDEVQRQLGNDESETLKATGRAPLHQTSASSFLVMGLELEEAKYVSYQPGQMN